MSLWDYRVGGNEKKRKKLEKRRIFEEAKGLGDGKLDYLSSFSVTDNLIINVMLLTDNNMF